MVAYAHPLRLVRGTLRKRKIATLKLASQHSQTYRARQWVRPLRRTANRTATLALGPVAEHIPEDLGVAEGAQGH